MGDAEGRVPTDLGWVRLPSQQPEVKDPKEGRS